MIASAALPSWPARFLCSRSLGLRSALRLRLAPPLRRSLGVEPLRQLRAPRCAIPLLEGLWRYLALDQQLSELPALRFALDWHRHSRRRANWRSPAAAPVRVTGRVQRRLDGVPESWPATHIMGGRFFRNEFLTAILPFRNVNRSHPLTSTRRPSFSVPVKVHSDTPRFPVTKCRALAQRASGYWANTAVYAARRTAVLHVARR